MLCKVCGGQATYARDYYLDYARGLAVVIEFLCWRCFAWSAFDTPVFGKLYQARK